MLLNCKATVDAVDNNRNHTPLMYAAQNGYPEVCAALVEASADVHERILRGPTALILAAQNGDNKPAAEFHDNAQAVVRELPGAGATPPPLTRRAGTRCSAPSNSSCRRPWRC